MPDDSAPSTKYFSPASVERAKSRLIAATHVEREAHQLEAEIERDQVGRRDQHQHAGRREQDQDRIFEPLLPLDLEIVDRHQDRGRRAGQRQQLEEARERIDHEAAAEGDELAGRQPDHDRAGTDQQQDREPVHGAGGALAAERAEHQQHHGADREHDLRQSRKQIAELGGFVHRRSLRVILVTAPAAPRSWRRRAPG